MSETNIQHAIDATRTFFMDKNERMAYINHEMAMYDYESDKPAFINKGVQQGQQKKNLELARNLKELGADLVFLSIIDD